jgi:hypothetical protein
MEKNSNNQLTKKNKNSEKKNKKKIQKKLKKLKLFERLQCDKESIPVKEKKPQDIVMIKEDQALGRIGESKLKKRPDIRKEKLMIKEKKTPDKFISYKGLENPEMFNNLKKEDSTLYFKAQ